ncbi:MAG: hypothetical protein GY810_03775 [Aureispira sp.]|nr:hypothetical protein [Aureispira sp.]
MNYLLYIWCFLGMLSLCQGQSSYYWKLTDEDGLPSMEVYDILQDSKGYVWIATDGGLCRFDGMSLKTYKHPEQKGLAATRIQEDERGFIWYKNFKNQLFYVDSSNTTKLLELPNNVELNTYFIYKHLGSKVWINSNQFYVYDFNNKLWATDSIPNISPGAYAGNGSTELQATKDALVFINRKGELWTKTETSAALKCTIDADKFKNHIVYPFGQDSIVLVTRQAVYIDAIDQICNLKEEAVLIDQKEVLDAVVHTDAIWVRTRKGAYCFQKGSKGKWEQVYHLLENEQISAVQKDREGNIWIGTLQGGVYIFPSLDIQYFNEQNSTLTNSHIHCITKDAQERLFLGASDGNLMHFDPKSYQTTNRYTGKQAAVTAAVVDYKRAQILFSAEGLHVADLNDPSRIESKYVLLWGHEMEIYKEDQILAGNYLGAYTYSLVGAPASTQPDPSVFNNQAKYHTKYIKDGETQYPIIRHTFKLRKRTTAIWVDKLVEDKFWLGFGDSLFYYENTIPKPILTKENKSLSVTDIHQTENGTIWVTTPNDGVYGIDDNQVKYHFSLKDGLPSINCKTLTTDKDWLWVGTDKGLCKLNITTSEILVYNQLDGLVSEEIRDIEVVDGVVWAATIKGLIGMDTHTPMFNKTAPFIHLTAVYINNNNTPLDQGLELTYTQNNLKLDFQTTLIRGRGNYVYEYRLLGLDSVWLEQPSSTNFVRFQSLVSGDYVFEVRAKNEDGVRSIHAASIAFSIKPPYWQTWWFRGLSYLVMGLIVAIGLGWRYQIMRKRQAIENSMNQLRMQALQSQMNPHFVFNAMSTIQSYWVQKQPKIALMYHARFAKLMRLIFDYSKELTIHIEDELEFLKTYVSLEQMRFEDKVEVVFDVEENLVNQEVYIPPLLIQPIVENSFKHGFLHKEEPGLLQVVLKKEGNYLYCKIVDDGVGRVEAKENRAWQNNEEKERSSTDVVIERLAILNKTYGANSNQVTFKVTDLESADGQANGTQIEMWIPLK